MPDPSTFDVPALEDVAVGGRDAGPLVADRHAGAPARRVGRHRDRAATVAQRVLQQHVEHLPGRRRRAARPGAAEAELDVQGTARVAVGAAPAGEVLADHRVEIEVGHALVPRAARVEQQRVDGRVEAVGFGERQVGLGPPRLRVVDLGDLLEAQAQCRQRRAQLMGDVARELALARDRLGDALGAGVQRPATTSISGIPKRPARAEKSPCAEPSRRPGQVSSGRNEAPCLQRGERGRREQRPLLPGRRSAATTLRTRSSTSERGSDAVIRARCAAPERWVRGVTVQAGRPRPSAAARVTTTTV